MVYRSEFNNAGTRASQLKVTGAANYYAKYVAGYQVMYNLAGGKFSDGSTTATEKHNVDTDGSRKRAAYTCRLQIHRLDS